MRAAIESWLTRRWYGDAAPGLGLRALAGIHRLLALTQKSTAAERIPVPVLVVGNFTAGGTGKTPLVIALASYLSTRGFRPGIVTRGHGRRAASPMRVSDSTPAESCGDEPKLMFERTRLPVLVDRDRAAAARAAVAAGCDLVIADDGLQHRRLARDVEIEVVDGERGYGNGLLIPAGPLREAPRVCDFRVVNGDAPNAGDWSMHLRLRDAISLQDPQQLKALSQLASSPVHAVAGIGNPARFFKALRGAGLEIIEHGFEDHHPYSIQDFSGMTGPILMTEKDAVKCGGLGLKDAWAVPVEAELSPGFFEAVEEKLRQHHART